MEKLKPCPFCGGEAAQRDFTEPFVNGWVGCQKCHCFINWVKGGKPEAVAVWNRRAAPENKELTLEQLRQMDGEPVFVASPGAEEYGHWVIVAGVDDTDGDKTLYCSGDFTCRDYGSVWLAYARKPEGSEKT